MESEYKADTADATRVEMRCALHLERVAAGTCGRCGNYFCQACSGRREADAQLCKTCSDARSYVAWEDRSFGLWQRYYRTVRGSLGDLPRFAAELPARGSLRLALVFALLPTSFAALLGAALLSLLLGFITGSMRNGSYQTLPAVVLGGIMFVTYTMMILFAFFTYLFVWPLLMVLTARLLGRRELTYRGALVCLCYASGLNWLYCVPLVGLVAAAYHFVVTSLCVGAMSRSSWLRGFAIYGLPTALFCLGSFTAYLAMIFTVLRAQH